MTTVAIDTATDRLSVALAARTGERHERHVTGARRHAARLVPELEALLREAGHPGPEVITTVIVADGPGSFTGLRVAAATAKALVRAGGAAMLAIPSLIGRAWHAAGPDGGLVLAATSALRGEVYAGWYRLAGGEVETVRPAEPLAPGGVRDGPRPDLIVGDGPDHLLEGLARHWSVALVAREAAQADARALLALARHRNGERWRVADPAGWVPHYGRPAEAQARWEREHGRPLPDASGHPG